MNDLIEAGLSKQVSAILAENNIMTMASLCSYSMKDIEGIQGIGKAACYSIAMARDKYRLSMDDQRVADAGAAALAARNPTSPKYLNEDPPKELRTVTTQEFTIHVQFRHAAWIKRAADVYQMTEAQVIDQAIRQAYARDPYKAGDTALSGSILAHDNTFKS